MRVYFRFIFKGNRSQTNQYFKTQNNQLRSILSIIFLSAVFWSIFVVVPKITLAGPPFVTDDPETVEYQHWEAYLAAQYKNDRDEVSSTLPHLEINYGL